MKRIFLFIFVALAAVTAEAQTFFGGGVSVTRSSSYDPSPLTRKDGGQTFAGAYVEGGYDLRHGLQARFLADYQTKPTLNSIFTSDADTGRVATSEFRFRPELRYQFSAEGKVKPFVAAGADIYRQFFRSTEPPAPTPGPLPAYAAYDEGGEYERAPSVGSNPYLTIGATIAEYYELSYSHLFADAGGFNNSNLRGERANASFTHPLFGRFHFKAGAEFDYVTFRDSTVGYIATYDKRDLIGRVRVGIEIR